MASISETAPERSFRSGFAGLRLTADEYFALPDDGGRYELIDGVVTMSPSPSTTHQRVALAVVMQIGNFVDRHGAGLVLYEVDVRLRTAVRRDLVYRPDIVYFGAEKASQVGDRIEIVPDVVVEIVSPDSRGLDYVTKLGDYERAGVEEYWIIDPPESRMSFHRLQDGSFAPGAAVGDFFASTVIPGFTLDLAIIRREFGP